MTIKKIWIIDHYSSEPKYGGISRQYDFAVGLAKYDYDVTIISSSFSHFKHDFLFKEHLKISPINRLARYAYVYTTPYKKNNGIKRLINAWSFLFSIYKQYKNIASVCGEPDVIVGCSIHPFTWIISYYLKRVFKAKFVVEVRDLWPADQIYNEGMSRLNPMVILLSMLEKWAYNKSDKIIYSMSRGDEYICNELGYPKSKTEWISQPMDCQRFDINAKRYDELPKEVTNFISHKFICVFTGYFMDYEGVHEMLKAAKIIKDRGLNDIRFVFVGSGKEESSMKEYCRNNMLDNVLIHERIDKELIPALLRRADICLAHLGIRGNSKSFLFDASKNKLTEYMYSNSCIIYGTNVQNQYVETSGAGFTISTFNHVQFADKIETVYRMYGEEREKYGKNAKEFVMQNNALDVLIKKYIKVIKSL